MLGSKLGECMQTAVYRLSERKEGDAKMGAVKYRCARVTVVVHRRRLCVVNIAIRLCSFKWGTKPVMELSLAAYTKHSAFLWICFGVWVFVLLYTFMPLLFA